MWAPCVRKMTAAARPVLARSMLMTRGVQTAAPFNPEEYARQYLVPTYSGDGVRGKPGLYFTHGAGQYVYDVDENEYLDFCAGIAVTALGHSDVDWCKTLIENSTQVCHTSNLFHTQAPLELAKLLVDNSGFDKAFFCNSGTEANEAALKFARLYANQVSKGTFIEGKKTEFIAFKGSFHGRTLGALSVTHKPAIREPFMPLMPNVQFAEFNNLDSVAKLFSEKTAGVIVECVQGESGVHPASLELIHGLRKLCDEFDAVMIVDEVQTGLGRTGKLFAHEHFDIQPDIMTLAKPLAGGLPIGAVLTRDTIAQAVSPSDHGTTFGANPLICSVAQVVVKKILQPHLIENVQKRGEQLADGLRRLKDKHPTKVKDVRVSPGGKGLMAALELKGPVQPVIKYALDQHVLLITAGANVIRMVPPLIIKEKDVARVLDVIDAALTNEAA